MKRRFFLILLVATVTGVAVSAQVARPLVFKPAQSTAALTSPEDPFFDDTVLHEIRLEINAKD